MYDLAILVGGEEAGTPVSSSFMVCLKRCIATATLGTSSVILDLRGTLPSLLASVTSVTNLLSILMEGEVDHCCRCSSSKTYQSFYNLS